MGKYCWRCFSKLFFMHGKLRVMVINCHTRAGGGSQDTADGYRTGFVETIRDCCHHAITHNLADLVVVAGDFNLVRPWKESAAKNFERHMHIDDSQAKFHHFVPDHVVVYSGNERIELIELNVADTQKVGAGHDAAGDHAAVILDVRYAFKTSPFQEVVVVEQNRLAPPSCICEFVRVISCWSTDEGGYLTPLEMDDLIEVLYRGEDNTEEQGWAFGTRSDAVGWFPMSRVEEFHVEGVLRTLEAASAWTSQSPGFLILQEHDIVECIYQGQEEDEIGWSYGIARGKPGWFPTELCKQMPAERRSGVL